MILKNLPFIEESKLLIALWQLESWPIFKLKVKFLLVTPGGSRYRQIIHPPSFSMHNLVYCIFSKVDYDIFKQLFDYFVPP